MDKQEFEHELQMLLIDGLKDNILLNKNLLRKFVRYAIMG